MSVVCFYAPSCWCLLWDKWAQQSPGFGSIKTLKLALHTLCKNVLCSLLWCYWWAWSVQKPVQAKIAVFFTPCASVQHWAIHLLDALEATEHQIQKLAWGDLSTPVSHLGEPRHMWAKGQVMHGHSLELCPIQLRGGHGALAGVLVCSWRAAPNSSSSRRV